MRLFKTAVLIHIALVTVLFSKECDLITSNQTRALDLVEKAEALYDEENYSEAYELLLKSYELYDQDTGKVTLQYTCYTYTPGPYAPTIEEYRETETKDFNRLALGKDIKKFLNPLPYVFIEFQDKATRVSVANVKNTAARAQVANRLPLENFQVTLAQKNFTFGTVNSGAVQTRTQPIRAHEQSQIQTSEKFGFKLYK